MAHGTNHTNVNKICIALPLSLMLLLVTSNNINDSGNAMQTLFTFNSSNLLHVIIINDTIL